ncbi:InlB B-repeat-containing protein [Rhodoluna sp. KAS3]|uniref:InlB B-repeat-containing protein n=1 Tax=Rhodoluna sp. KAS3 TaxID=942880 RepID=UPI002230999A|nr:InlB B-repeat-containing protein [Rhodoluna sp. KAS3]BDS49632.1 hypothetical protein RKAS3_12090 [Rhodoluna sp. KAS3]
MPKKFRTSAAAFVTALLTLSPLIQLPAQAADANCPVVITSGGNQVSDADVDVYLSGIYCVAKFKTVGAYTFVVPETTGQVDYLVVGGGGGGASGGGGAGGVLQGTNYSVTPGVSVAVSVGAGGAGGSGGLQNSDAPGGKGDASSFDSITAAGGGGGAAANQASATAADGASGGGSRFDCTRNPCERWGSLGYAGKGIAGQGNNGGYGTYSDYGAAGGGGGAGGAGFNTTRRHIGGNGGIGVASSISGTETYYGGGGGGGINSNSSTYYGLDANGNLYSSNDPQTTGGGQGGIGGGGRGSSFGFSGGTTHPNFGVKANATAGEPNTGGGGGGVDPEDTGGKPGGSGVVIVRWLADASVKTVTFSSNFGTATTQTQRVGSNVPTALKPATFTRTGYTFVGWNTAANGSGTAYANLAEITTTNDVTLYAQWRTGVTHTVTFDANGGTGSMANQSSGTEATLNKNTFTRANYEFIGWNTAADGTGFAYADEGKYAFVAAATLYAQWQAVVVNYKATFYGNGATGGTTPTQLAPGQTALTLNGFTRTGYSFLGWSTNYSATTAQYLDGANYAFTSDVDLYAIWVVKANRDLVFNGNGATAGSTPTQTAMDNTQVNANGFTRDGFTFRHWNTAADGTGVSYQSNYVYSFAAGLTLYAVWGQNYSVTYHGNGAASGTVPTSQNSYVGSNGITAALNSGNLTKEGMRLIGWNTAADGTGTPVALGAANQKFTANTTLYAQWESAVYAVVYSGNGAVAGIEPSVATVPATSAQIVIADNSGGLTLDGHEFDGWNTEPDGTGTTYEPEQTAVVTNDTVLFASWKVASTGGGGNTNVEPSPSPSASTNTGGNPSTRAIVISGFAAGSDQLTTQMRQRIKVFLKKYPSYTKVKITGYTTGPTVLRADYGLSKRRALNTKSVMANYLGANQRVTKVMSRQDTGFGGHLRRIKIVLTN